MTRKRKRYDRQFKAAAQVVLSGDTGVVDPAKEPGIKDPALRRRAQGRGEMGDAAFPGNGSPKASKDHEIVKLKKRVEEPGRENELLKNSRPFSSQGRA